MAVVGRDSELEAVEAFLAEVCHGGEVRAFVLEGEPGIGKTVIWEAGLRLAEARGLRVLAARTAETEATLSYAALSDLVTTSYDDVRSTLPPPLAHALDIVLLRAEGDIAVDQRAVGTGLVRILAEVARAQPVLMAIDDVQWLDHASRRVLEFAIRRLPAGVGVLVTLRLEPEEEVPLGLGHGPAERMALGPLGLASLLAVIRDELGSAPPRPVLLRIASASGGNPFYALEIARMVAAKDWIFDDAAAVPVPETLQRLVLARVRRLSAAAQNAALAIATLSRPTAELVSAALGRDPDSEAAIVEAARADVIVADGAVLHFTHPLLASAVYASASHKQRRELHKRLATVVGDPEERARHAGLGEETANEVVAAQIENAGQRAAHRGAQDAAAELYAAAVRLTPKGRGSALARRVLLEATALLSVGDPGGARRAAELALERSETVDLRAEANLLLGEIAWLDEPGARPIEYLERALDEASVPSLRGRIHARLVTFSLGNHTRAADHANAALALLDADADPALYAHTLIDKVFFDAQAGRGAHPGLIERAFELEEHAGPEVERNRVALIWLVNMDESAAGRVRHQLEDEWYRDRGEELWRAERRSFLARLELNAGNWDLAESLNDESRSVLEQTGVGAGPWSAATLLGGQIDVLRGRSERALAEITRLVEDAEQTGSRFFAALALAPLGLAQLSSGDAGAADRSFARMDEHYRAMRVVDPTGARTGPDHVEALLALGEIRRAREELDRLERRAERLPRPWLTTALPRVRALVLAAEGSLSAALDAAGDVDETIAARVPFEHARTLLVRGQLLRRSKQKRVAADTLETAVGLFERLGAPMWIGRARSELDRVGLRPPPTDDLTPSERRVAELAATGLTNREVAAAAFMSPKTVEANLTRIYRKFGIHSRAELGARMAEGHD